MTLGEKLRQLRQERGWTQREVARYVGVHKVTIGAYERDRICPSEEVIKKLEQLFDVDLSEHYTFKKTQYRGRVLTRIRKQRGWTQKELAKHVGVSRDTIRQYENDLMQPSVATARKIENVLGIKIWDLRELRRRKPPAQYQYADEIVLTPSEKKKAQLVTAVFCRLYKRLKDGVESGEIRLSSLSQEQVKRRGMLAWFMDAWHAYAAQQRELGRPIDFENLILELVEERARTA